MNGNVRSHHRSTTGYTSVNLSNVTVDNVLNCDGVNGVYLCVRTSLLRSRSRLGMIQTEGESEDEVIWNNVWAEWRGGGARRSSVGRGAGCSGLEPTTNRIRLRAERPSPTAASRHQHTISRPTQRAASGIGSY